MNIFLWQDVTLKSALFTMWSFASFLLFLLVCSFAATLCEDNLRLVQVLFRHGDRTPNRPWGPNDPNGEDVWPQGWGQLTRTGKLQMFRLGEVIKNRYRGFLSKDYVNREIYVMSTGRDRALMSAQSLLAGMYPPADDERFHSSVAWQPIPVHSNTIDEDWVMRPTKVCPETADEYFDDFLRDSQEIHDHIETHRTFIERLTKNAGLYKEGSDVKNLKKMWKLGGNLHIARRYNKTLPSWADCKTIDKLVQLRVKKFESQAHASPRLTGGTLLGRLLRNMKDFSTGSLRPKDHGQKESGITPMKPLKLMLFSGHDSNIVFLLGAMGLFTKPFWPSYGSAVFFELRELTHDGHSVTIFLMNGLESEFEELSIPGCSSPCSLQRLIDRYESTAVWSKDEFQSLCHRDNLYSWGFLVLEFLRRFPLELSFSILLSFVLYVLIARLKKFKS